MYIHDPAKSERPSSLQIAFMYFYYTTYHMINYIIYHVLYYPYYPYYPYCLYCPYCPSCGSFQGAGVVYGNPVQREPETVTGTVTVQGGTPVTVPPRAYFFYCWHSL